MIGEERMRGGERMERDDRGKRNERVTPVARNLACRRNIIPGKGKTIHSEHNIIIGRSVNVL